MPPKRKFQDGYVNVTVSLSPTWRDRLDALAKKLGFNRSETVRRMTEAIDSVDFNQLPENSRNALTRKGEEEEQD